MSIESDHPGAYIRHRHPLDRSHRVHHRRQASDLDVEAGDNLPPGTCSTELSAAITRPSPKTATPARTRFECPSKTTRHERADDQPRPRAVPCRAPRLAATRAVIGVLGLSHSLCGTVQARVLRHPPSLVALTCREFCPPVLQGIRWPRSCGLMPSRKRGPLSCVLYASAPP